MNTSTDISYIQHCYRFKWNLFDRFGRMWWLKILIERFPIPTKVECTIRHTITLLKEKQKSNACILLAVFIRRNRVGYF